MRVERVFQIMELVGTVAFAISGVIAGVRHHMDVFGTTVLGLVTAVGGGIVRDMMIGRLPPTVFLHPLCAIVALLTSLFLFFLMYILKAEAGTRLKRPEDILLFVTDTVGLGVFTVLGIETTVQAGYTGRAMLLFVGIITGIGGGIFRDVYLLRRDAGHVVDFSVRTALARPRSSSLSPAPSTPSARNASPMVPWHSTTTDGMCARTL